MKVPDRVVILGDNETAVMAANKLLQRSNRKEIEIIMVGKSNYLEFKDANIFIPTSLVDHHMLRRSIDSQLNNGVQYINDEVVRLNPKDKSLNTRNGKLIRYDYLLITNAFNLNNDKIVGFSEEMRTVETIQESLKLRQDVVKIKKGEVVVYQDKNSLQSTVGGVNLSVLLANYFKEKDLDKDVKVTYVTSNEKLLDNENLQEKIVSTLENNGISQVFGFSLSQINVKNREFTSTDGKTIKYDIPIVIGTSELTNFMKEANFQKSDISPVEVDFKTLSIKGFPEIFITCFGPKFKSSFWEMNYEQVDFITAKIAHNISGYPEPDSHSGIYMDYLLEAEERATSFSVDLTGEYSQGRSSRSDYLLKLYSYHSYFGGYSQGYL